MKTVRNLMRHFKGQLAPRALRGIRADLRNAFDEEMKRFAKEKTAKAVERVLRRVAKELERIDVKGKEWKALSPGVKSTYAEGQHAYQTALKDPLPENFHEWRKCAKDLWYQVTLLRRVWPEQIDAMAKELETLGEYLGDDHDLVMLRQAVQKSRVDESRARELETLNGLIQQRQHELRAAALALGARFYAERPSSFCNRLAGYWQIWCGEKKSSARLAGATV